MIVATGRFMTLSASRGICLYFISRYRLHRAARFDASRQYRRGLSGVSQASRWPRRLGVCDVVMYDSPQAMIWKLERRRLYCHVHFTPRRRLLSAVNGVDEITASVEYAGHDVIVSPAILAG